MAHDHLKKPYWVTMQEMDQMTLFFMPDLLAKAIAYSAFGHQSMFDENTPFKISRHANQPATNLVNLNNVMRSTTFK